MKVLSRRMDEESAVGWFAVRTKPNAEGKVWIGIEAARMQAYLPTELIRITHRNRSETQWRPLFPSHLFVLITSQDTHKLREIDGVDDVVRRDGKPASIADDVIRAIRRAERDGLFDAAAGVRRPDDNAPPPDARHAGLVARIRRGRFSKERTKLLMELLVGDLCKT
jgi:hypothetical protein